MRWLLLSDIHGDARSLELVLFEARPFDLVLIAGDISDFGGSEAARRILAPLVAAKLPSFAVSGNCDHEGVRNYIEDRGLSVEGRGRSHAGLHFVGAGGGLRRHGMTPNEPTEEELESALVSGLSEADRQAGHRVMGPELVIITHTPPNGTLLDRRGAEHVGSHALRSQLGDREPLLWLSGHIHEARSKGLLGRSILVNPGSLHDGFYAMAEFSEGERLQVELRRLGDRTDATV